MHIHILPKEKFTISFINFAQTYFGDNHVFYIYGSNDSFELIKGKNIVYATNLSKEVDFALLSNRNDKIFIHSFITKDIIKFLFFRCKKYMKRVVLIPYGAEIYDMRVGPKNKRIKYYIAEAIKRRIISRAKFFMTFACYDYEIMEKYYKAKGLQFDCLYPSNVNCEAIHYLKSLPKTRKETINILIGNSATPTNQHFEIFNKLIKFRNQNIRFYCPLSYGDANYAKKVSLRGNELFGDHFIPVTEYMSPKEYASFLNTMDIAVFNNNRQQGTGNIEILGYLGKKIFIRSDVSTWLHYVVRDHCHFFDSIAIDCLEYEDFIHVSDEDVEFNFSYFSKIWDDKYIYSLWKEVIEYEV